MNRRGFLGALSAVPVIGPAMASKMALDAGIAHAAGVSRATGLSGYGGLQGGPPATQCLEPSLTQDRLAFQLPWLRRQLESEFYDMLREVNALDVDLAAKRSFSMAAKIAFQRQRNVARVLALRASGSGYAYQRINRAILSALGINT